MARLRRVCGVCRRPGHPRWSASPRAPPEPGTAEPSAAPRRSDLEPAQAGLVAWAVPVPVPVPVGRGTGTGAGTGTGTGTGVAVLVSMKLLLTIYAYLHLHRTAQPLYCTAYGTLYSRTSARRAGVHTSDRAWRIGPAYGTGATDCKQLTSPLAFD